MLPKVKTIERTCSACPAQWNLFLEDGRFVYVRYRGGRFSAGIGESETAYWKQDDWYNLIQIYYGEPLDGYMLNEKMIEMLEGYLDFSSAKIIDTDDINNKVSYDK